MAIQMTYACTECAFKTVELDAAQLHADRQQHVVGIRGTITARAPLFDKEQIEASAREKAFNSALLRAARDRGLLPKDGVRK